MRRPTAADAHSHRSHRFQFCLYSPPSSRGRSTPHSASIIFLPSAPSIPSPHAAQTMSASGKPPFWICACDVQCPLTAVQCSHRISAVVTAQPASGSAAVPSSTSSSLANPPVFSAPASSTVQQAAQPQHHDGQESGAEQTQRQSGGGRADAGGDGIRNSTVSHDAFMATFRSGLTLFEQAVADLRNNSAMSISIRFDGRRPLGEWREFFAALSVSGQNSHVTEHTCFSTSDCPSGYANPTRSSPVFSSPRCVCGAVLRTTRLSLTSSSRALCSILRA